MRTLAKSGLKAKQWREEKKIIQETSFKMFPPLQNYFLP